MPYWQEGGVVIIVLGALVFLARRLFGFMPSRKKKGMKTFVPLGQVRRHNDGCH